MGTEEQTENGGGVATASDSLTITDNRTGKSYEVPIEDGTVRATALRDIKVNESDFGVMTYDPAFMNTASCRSAITYLDGEAGVLEYRGYPIEQLAEHSTYLEVAYLLVHGELPNQKQLDEWVAPDHDPHVRARERHAASCRASATTRTRWGCCWRRSARSRRSIRTRTRSRTRRPATCRSSG